MTWIQKKFPTLYEPTVMDRYYREHEYKDKVIGLRVQDTAGHEDLGRLRPIAYSNTDCFVICFDLT